MERGKVLDKATLTELQEIEVDIFKKTVEICNKLGLTYYLLGGTLLGAVRHGGFIPWDDDIDIGMPRADYEVFVKEAQKYYPENMFLQHYTTEKNTPITWCKIRRSDTAFMETTIRGIKMNKGIFVDVFPLDFYPDDEEKRKRLRAKDAMLKQAMFLKLAPQPSGIMRLLSSIKYRIRTCFITYRGAARKRDRLHKEIVSGSRLANYDGAWGEKEIVPAEWYGKGVLVNFEGVECRAPSEYHKWLTQVYGDYMQLPPEEKRVTQHYTDVIDTKRSYLQYETYR